MLRQHRRGKSRSRESILENFFFPSIGALWQKFIRRGAKIRFGDESAVNDIHATFIDTTMGSCGEISDWVEGRTWLLEVDEWMDLLKKYKRKKKTQNNQRDYTDNHIALQSVGN